MLGIKVDFICEGESAFFTPGLSSGGWDTPFPAQCLPAQVPGSRSAGLWLCTTQHERRGPWQETWGHSVEGAVARGSVTCCTPNTEHTRKRKRGAEAEQVGRASSC